MYFKTKTLTFVYKIDSSTRGFTVNIDSLKELIKKKIILEPKYMIS